MITVQYTHAANLVTLASWIGQVCKAACTCRFMTAPKFKPDCMGT